MTRSSVPPRATDFATAAVLCVLAVLLPAGCQSTAKEKELQRVAKDWSMVIRASQVIPVYPLTEDLQPGDVFLVETPVQKQADDYETKGFLPLDQYVARLDQLDYEKLYEAGFFDDRYAKLPHARHKTPDQGGDVPPLDAPRASFPSYTFEVSTGKGLALALPVQGVPLGLSLLRSDSATGSVTLSDAYTYGASGRVLLERLHDWVRSNPGIRIELARIAAEAKKPVYLRVVSRVYIARGVTVSLVDRSARGGKLDVGAQEPLSILDVKDKATAENYQETLKAINQELNAQLPGGSVAVAQASDRSVTMAETFERPVVIGYLGFDVPFDSNGNLGAPVATLAQLERRVEKKEAAVVGQLDQEAHELRVRQMALVQQVVVLKKRDDSAAAKILAKGLATLSRRTKDAKLTKVADEIDAWIAQQSSTVNYEELAGWVAKVEHACKDYAYPQDAKVAESESSARKRILTRDLDDLLNPAAK